MKQQVNKQSNKQEKVFSLEGETKRRRNLSKLIHSVQHIPSNRSRLDQLDENPLGRLINELETFEPTMSSTAVTKTTERKHFSRKYLNLRLYPSPDKSKLQSSALTRKSQYISKDTLKTSNRFQKPKNKCTQNQTDSGSSNKENVKDHLQVQKSKSLYTSKHFMGDIKGNKIQNKLNKKDHLNNLAPSKLTGKEKSNRFVKSKEDMTYSQDSKKEVSYGNQKTSIITKMNFYGRTLSKSMEGTETPINQSNTSSIKSKSKVTTKVPLLMFNSSSQKANCAQHQMKLNQPVTMIRQNKRFFTEVQPSMVKKLTSYWNNLLNNEFEGYSSAPESSEITTTNTSTTKSIENCNKKTYVNDKDSSTTVASWHYSESCLNVSEIRKESYEQLDQLHSKTIAKDQKDKRKILRDELEQIHKNGCSLDLIKLYSSEESSSGCISTNSSSLKVFESEQNNPLGDYFGKTDDMPIEIDLKTESAIEVMQALISKLKLFPETSLASQDISVSKSIKVMLCLITARLLTSKEMFDNDNKSLECPLQKEVKETANNNCLAANDTQVLLPSNILEERDDKNSTVCQKLHVFFPPIIEEDSLSLAEYVHDNELQYLIPTYGITIQKVNRALKYLNLYKQYLWISFISDPFFSELQNKQNYPNYKIVIEGDLVFETECFQEVNDNFWDLKVEISQDYLDEFEDDTIMDVYNRASVIVEENICQFIDLIADKLPENWSGSLTCFMRSGCRLLVSLIIIWLFMKEMVFK